MKQYIIELVINDPPYISIGYVSNETKDKIELSRDEKNALVIDNQQLFNDVMRLIARWNCDPNNAYVMDWITEVGSKKRVFRREVDEIGFE